MADDGTRPLISRRGVITASLIAAVGTEIVLMGGADRAHAAGGETVTLAGTGFALTASGMAVTLTDPDGAALLLLGGYRFGDVKPTSGTSKLGAASDGAAAIIVDYVTGVAKTTLTGTFTPRGRRLEIVFDVTAPAGTAMSTATLRRQVVQTGITETSTGVPRWTRDPRGGVPFEEDTKLVLYEDALPGDHLYIALAGSKAAWHDSWSLNLPGTETSPGVYQAVANLAVTPQTTTKIAAAVATGAPVGIDLGTDRPFNIWTSAAAPLSVAGTAFNGGPTGQVTTKWTVRDFDGTELANRTTTQTVASGETWDSEISFAASGRTIAFVEFTVSSGSHTEFARTNVAILPPHTFVEGESSTIGLAADYLLGDVAERELIARLGTRWSRSGKFTAEELEKYGIHQNRLRTPSSRTLYEGDPEGLAAYIDGEIDTAEAAYATRYELANEWNLLAGVVLLGTGGAEYVADWAAPFKKRFIERGSSMKLMSVALAGMDYVYAQNMFDAGLAEHVDAFALHPGRGNFVPDYAPAPETWASGPYSTYWNFLGAVREARRMLNQEGPDIELWLTETYTCTQPNNWWHDTYRASGENAMLTHVLAKTEGVRATEWFQFYDGRKTSPTAARPDDPEYHYGLVMRDHSPKPSLLGVATAAEHLDEATFVRWLDFSGSDTADTDIKGLLFDTPRGPMSVLWTRADGYILNADDHDDMFFPATEPWIDTWPTKTPVSIPATGDSVRQIDCIGRETTIAATDGHAEITLDGAARIYYGLDFTAHPEAPFA